MELGIDPFPEPMHLLRHAKLIALRGWHGSCPERITRHAIYHPVRVGSEKPTFQPAPQHRAVFRLECGLLIPFGINEEATGKAEYIDQTSFQEGKVWIEESTGTPEVDRPL